MKRMAKTGVMLFFIFAALAGPLLNAAVRADSGDYRNYAQVDLGLNQFSADLDDAGYDTGVASHATYGRYLSPYLAVEASLGFFTAQRDFSGSTGAAGSYTREDTLVVSSLLATLKGEIPVGPVSLYAGAGAGVYHASLNAEIDTANLGDFDVDDDDTVFGTHVVAGARYDIMSRLFAGVEGLYR